MTHCGVYVHVQDLWFLCACTKRRLHTRHLMSCDQRLVRPSFSFTRSHSTFPNQCSLTQRSLHISHDTSSKLAFLRKLYNLEQENGSQFLIQSKGSLTQRWLVCDGNQFRQKPGCGAKCSLKCQKYFVYITCLVCRKAAPLFSRLFWLNSNEVHLTASIRKLLEVVTLLILDYTGSTVEVS